MVNLLVASEKSCFIVYFGLEILFYSAKFFLTTNLELLG